MPQTIRHILAASGVAALTLSAVVLPVGLLATSPAYAQGEPPKPVMLTQKQIDGLIAAQPAMVAAQPQSGGSDKPDPKLQAKMEAIVKKNGFTSLENYEAVSDSVGMVLAGMDPEQKTYVGPIAMIKKQIAEVKADKTMKAKDKAAALKELNEALSAGDGAKPPSGNIELVAKNFDKLAQVMQGGGGND